MGLINEKEVTMLIKIDVYKAIYRAILIFGCDSRVLSKQDRRSDNIAEIR